MSINYGTFRTLPELEEGSQRVRESIGIYNLPLYKIEALTKFCGVKDFSGARVLEIGGHDLHPDIRFGILGAKSWHCLDIVEHGSGNYQSYVPATGDEPESIKLSDLAIQHMESKSTFINGSILDIPDIMFGKYDICVSICAFEHINNFPIALNNMHSVLSVGGSMLSYYGPIWSCYCGHHMYFNENINFNNLCQIDHFDHLIFSQSEMTMKLINEGFNLPDAVHIVNQMYHSPIINRLFYEDYVSYLTQSKFSGFALGSYGDRQVDKEIMHELKQRYPNKSRFDAYGIIANAWKLS